MGRVRVRVDLYSIIHISRHDPNPTHEHELLLLLDTIPHSYRSVFNDLIFCQVRINIYNFTLIFRHNLTETGITTPTNREQVLPSSNREAQKN
jgi:hypothetical protein